ncbi:MAG TPA: extracellular solute-binding protein, partial [Aggregatilineales bacterium]|nr:extracellular solute-binding protein [Aggregatilineales bacterium]
MRLRRRPIVSTIFLILAIAALLPLATLQAQTANNTVISLVVSNFNADIFTGKIISDFEGAHPGVKVNIVKDNASIPSETGGLDAYFTALAGYVNQGDVLYISSSNMVSPAATNAGYFLDLAPLASSDSSLKSDDFFPSVWNAYQWDKGLWALPFSADAQVMSYDPTAFDKVGLAYPDEKWTLDDLVNAVNKLTQKDSSGTVTQAGLAVVPASSYSTLFRSLLGTGLFDSSSVPNVPKIDTPQMEALLDAWNQLEQNGEIGNSQNDFQNDPLSIGNASTFLRVATNPNSVRKGVLLPGGRAGLTTQAFAVSAGTTHPDEAYALAAYLTMRPELINRGALSPARQSLAGVQNGGGGGGPRGGRNIT